MTIELINPSGPPQPRGYAPVGMGTGRHTIFLSGQVARTADGTPVGAGDLAAQVEQAYLNVVAALAGAGAIFADLVKLTVYVVDWSPEKMGALVEGATRWLPDSGSTPSGR